MKKIYLFLLLSFLGISLHSQSYEQFGTPMGLGSGTYGYYNNYGDSVSFIFTGLPVGAIGNSYVAVFFFGDDGDVGEDVDVYMDNDYIGNRAQNTNGDCAPEDSVALAVAYANLNTYISNDTIIVTCWPSSNVDFFCGQTTLRCKIMYDYCSAGFPVAFADFTISDTTLCSYQAPVTLTGNLPSGSFSGTGVTGNSFDPSGLLPGDYTITYTGMDSIGCTTDKTRKIKILGQPSISNYKVCKGDSATMVPSGSYQYIWYSLPNYAGVIDTTVGPLSYGGFNQPTTLYVADLISNTSYWVDSILTRDSLIIDVDFAAGDDRGTIAVTDSFVFYNGDSQCARYDLDLNLASETIFAITDGLFADNLTQDLYTFSSDNLGTFFNSGDATIVSIQQLGSSLNPIGLPIQLSAPITVGGSSNIVLTGAGAVGLHSSSTGHTYIISLPTGFVTDLGVITTAPINYSGETWADYGVLEYDGSSYSMLYADFSSNIVRHTLPAGTPTAHTTFPLGMSDMACFTFSHLNSRWYFHHEYGSGTFGGMNETLGFADGVDNLSPNSGVVGCYVDFNIDVDVIDLGNDTVVCANQTPVILEAGNGFESYTWNGVNNNWNIYPVTASGQYVVDAVNDIGCHVIDTVNVTVNGCAGVEENEDMITNIYPNPNNGNFTIEINPGETETIELEVMDMQGRKLYTKVVEVTEGIHQIPVQLFNLTDGIYMVNIKHHDHHQAYRIVIKK